MTTAATYTVQTPNTHTEAPAPSDYAAKAQRLVPGRSDRQTMAAILIAERAPEQADVLVVGAGGGVELSAFAGMYPQWRFVGVDPSQPMLALADAALGASIARVELLHGYVDAASPCRKFGAA